MPGVFASASRTGAAAGPSAMPTGTARSPREGNAIAMTIDMTIGNTNVQKRASGSRMNSRTRESVSSTSG
jgi:hypothetical protein